MLAEPGDLLRGRTLGPADGQALSRGIRAYRAGKVLPPVKPKKK